MLAVGLGLLAAWLGDGQPYTAVGAVFFNLILTGVAYSLTYTGLEKRPTLFMSYLMGAMMIKMLVGILAILIIGIKFREHLATFALSYISSYFAFTGFEVYGLMRKLRALSKSH